MVQVAHSTQPEWIWLVRGPADRCCLLELQMNTLIKDGAGRGGNDEQINRKPTYIFTFELFIWRFMRPGTHVFYLLSPSEECVYPVQTQTMPSIYELEYSCIRRHFISSIYPIYTRFIFFYDCVSVSLLKRQGMRIFIILCGWYEYFIPSSLLLKLSTRKWWCNGGGDEGRKIWIIKLKLLGECDAHKHHSIDRQTSDRTTPSPTNIAFSRYLESVLV